MATLSDNPYLEAIPESSSVNYLPGSARSSPRSTSDSPARSTGLQPISQHSRLLQPTLSWQAKAGWIPNPLVGVSSSATHAIPDASNPQVQASTTAVSARNQALAAGRRTSLISPSTSFRIREEPQTSADYASGQQLLKATMRMWSSVV